MPPTAKQPERVVPLPAVQDGSAGGARQACLLDEAAVAAWEESGAPLIDLLRQAHVPGTVTGYRRNGRLSLLVTDPVHVQHVLGRYTDRYVKDSHRARVLLGDGVISATGEAWHRQRRLLRPHFTAAGVRKRYERHIAEAAARAARRWTAVAEAGDVTDLAEDLQFATVDVIWRTLTGAPLDQDTYRDLSAVQDIVAALPAEVGAATALRPETGVALAALDARMRRAIARSRHRRGTGATAGSAAPAEGALLHALLDASTEHPGYTDQLIRDELVTLLVAGYESSARTLAWAVLLLAGHPGVADWAGGRPERVDAVLSETLRLYPTGWLLPRRAVRDDTLDGWHVPAGSDVLTCPYLTHRDPRLWDGADDFDPTRFLRPGGTPQGPGAYLPYGLGPRACLGMQFAARETGVLLSALVTGFTLELLTPAPQAEFGLNLRPAGPLPARLLARG